LVVSTSLKNMKVYEVVSDSWDYYSQLNGK
jgi:hypothetical protein